MQVLSLFDGMSCGRIALDKAGTINISDTQRFRMLGNGWTADLVAWFFGFLKSRPDEFDSLAF